jgi:hypothetical protein
LSRIFTIQFIERNSKIAKKESFLKYRGADDMGGTGRWPVVSGVAPETFVQYGHRLRRGITSKL